MSSVFPRRFINRRTVLASCGGTLALALAMTPFAASAADVVSQANGRILDTTLLTTDLLDSIAALGGATAVNTDGTGDVVSDTPLDLNLLTDVDLLTVPSASLVGLTLGDLIHLGAVGQYAEADADGASKAFAGTVSAANSLIGVGQVTPAAGDADAGANAATIGLGADATSPVSLNAAIGVLAAGAQEAADGTTSGDYTLADLDLVVGGTVLQGVLDTLNPALNTLIGVVNGISQLDDITNPLADGQITLSLEDLLAAAGVASINDLPAGTDLVQYIPTALVTKVTSIVDGLLDTVTADIAVLNAIPILGPALALTLQTALGVAQAALDPLLAGLAGTLTPTLGSALSALISLKVGVQETVDGAFSETALTVGVLNGGAITEIDLAKATVGPNAGLLAVPIVHPEALGIASILVIIGAGVGFMAWSGRRRPATRTGR